jgi:hypothetical protein
MRIPLMPIGRRTWLCLSEADLAAYADGALRGRRRTRAERHLAKCGPCRAELGFLLQSERSPAQPVPPGWLARVRHLADQPDVPQRTRVWEWAGVGAIACLAVAGTWMAVRPREVPVTVATVRASSARAIVAQPAAENATDQVRHTGHGAVGLVVIAPGSGATVARDAEIRWQPLAVALSYDLVILNASGDTVWRTRTNADNLHLPSNAPLHGGEKYFVIISANLVTGKTLRAKAIAFQIAATQDKR